MTSASTGLQIHTTDSLLELPDHILRVGKGAVGDTFHVSVKVLRFARRSHEI